MLTFITFLFLIVPCLAQEKLNFEDLPKLIASRNKKATAAALDLNASQMRLGYFRRSFIPRIEAAAGRERFSTGPFETMNEPFYSFRGAINLYRGGRDQLEEKARKAERDGFSAFSQQTFQNELFESRQLYWDLVFFREIRKLYLYSLEQNKQNLVKAQRLISAGLATKVDRLEFEVSDTQLKQDLARFEVEISKIQRQLAALLGDPADTVYETIEQIPHFHNDKTASETMDFAIFRDVRIEMANQLSLEASSQILKRWWVPNLDIYGESILFTFRERSFFTERDRVDTAIGISLSLAFDGFQQKIDGEAQAARARASGLRAQQIRSESEAIFNTAQQELALLHNLIHEGEKNVEKGQEYLSAVLSEYSRGVKNSPDVLGAILKNLEFRKRFAELRRDYAVSNARLESMLAHDH